MRLANNPMLKVKNKKLYFDDLEALRLMKKNDTPIFIFFTKKIVQNCESFKEKANQFFPKNEIYYSVKTNFLPEILSIIASTGMSAQVVSLKELELAKNNNFNNKNIIFDGIFHDQEFFKLVKKDRELMPIESWKDNIDKINEIASSQGITRPIGLRFKSLKKNSRLGLSFNKENEKNELIKTLQKADNLEITMLASHPGSQIMDKTRHQQACLYLLEIYDVLEKQGLTNKNIFINLGGGFPEPEIANIEFLSSTFQNIKDKFNENHNIKKFTICFEPGRYIMADAGILVSRINQLFHDEDENRWALLDAGMDVMSRFANNHFRFFSLEHPSEPHGYPISFQGRLPTEQDVFGKKIHFVKNVQKGNHVVMLNCGAYSFTFSYRFSYKLPKYGLLNGENFKISHFQEAFSTAIRHIKD
ncbi:MAG: alanine racemase, partial [Promethearchaeota archaeon]